MLKIGNNFITDQKLKHLIIHPLPPPHSNTHNPYLNLMYPKSNLSLGKNVSNCQSSNYCIFTGVLFCVLSVI